jgi:hypothetical protein
MKPIHFLALVATTLFCSCQSFNRISQGEISQLGKIGVISPFGGTFRGKRVGSTIFKNEKFTHKLPKNGLGPVFEESIIDELEDLPVELVALSADCEQIKTTFNVLDPLFPKYKIDEYLESLETRGFGGLLILNSRFNSYDPIYQTHQIIEDMGFYCRSTLNEDFHCFVYAVFDLEFFNLRTGKHKLIGKDVVYSECSYNSWPSSFSEIPLQQQKEMVGTIAAITRSSIKNMVAHKLRGIEYAEPWWERMNQRIREGEQHNKEIRERQKEFWQSRRSKDPIPNLW